jgi:hypothetical protein
LAISLSYIPFPPNDGLRESVAQAGSCDADAAVDSLRTCLTRQSAAATERLLRSSRSHSHGSPHRRCAHPTCSVASRAVGKFVCGAGQGSGQCRFRKAYKGLYTASIAKSSPATAGLSSASTGQNRQHSCFPSAMAASSSLRKPAL